MNKAYKMTEIVGCSAESYEDAIKSAIDRARKTLTGLLWFEVTDLRGAILDKGVEYQATLKIGFKLKDK